MKLLDTKQTEISYLASRDGELEVSIDFVLKFKIFFRLPIYTKSFLSRETVLSLMSIFLWRVKEIIPLKILYFNAFSFNFKKLRKLFKVKNFKILICFIEKYSMDMDY